MLKYFFILFALLVVLVVSIAGFRGQKSRRSPIEIFPDMDHQPKVKAQVASSFFSDARSDRGPVAYTVPIGYAIPLHKPVNDSVGEVGGRVTHWCIEIKPDCGFPAGDRAVLEVVLGSESQCGEAEVFEESRIAQPVAEIELSGDASLPLRSQAVAHADGGSQVIAGTEVAEMWMCREA